MARSLAALPSGSRIADFISLGVLARWFPRRTVDRVLRESGKTSRRQRDLPAHAVVYSVIALALYRRLLEGWQWLGGPLLKVAGDSGISQARSRLGVEPLEKLHDELVRPLATAKTRGAFYRKWRLVSLDGSTLDVADEAANREAFGYPGASRGTSGEITLAKQVLPALEKGMLCSADPNFLGYELCRQARRTGADLLWRAKKNLRLEVLGRFADGSYRSAIYASEADWRKFHEAVIAELLDERVGSSRGMRRPRGVRRKMNSYKLRPRGALSRDRIDFASCVRIVK